MNAMTDERLNQIKREAGRMRSCMDLVSAMLQTKAKDELHEDQMQFIEELLKEVERLRADAARLDWIDRADGPQLDRLVDHLGRGRSRREIDLVAGEDATWLPK